MVVINGKKYITVKEMAESENVDSNTIKQRLYQHDIKPLSKDALYAYSDYEKIKDAVKGRPKKETKVSGAAAPKKKGKNGIKQKTH